MTVIARTSRLLCASAALLLAASCSDDSSVPADFGPPVDISNIDYKYPEGPYGFAMGDIATSEEFLAYSDPDNFCKAHKDKQLDLETLVKLGFHSWYQENSDEKCPEKHKDLLWVQVSAGWCGPCQNEVKEIVAQYSSGAFDPRVGLLNVVFETSTRGTPVTREFGKVWAQELGITFPVAIDPKFHMGKYFDKAATPFNMLVDTSNMKIFYTQVGSDLKEMGLKVQEFLASK